MNDFDHNVQEVSGGAILPDSRGGRGLTRLIPCFLTSQNLRRSAVTVLPVRMPRGTITVGQQSEQDR